MNGLSLNKWWENFNRRICPKINLVKLLFLILLTNRCNRDIFTVYPNLMKKNVPIYMQILRMLALLCALIFFFKASNGQ